MATAIDLQQDAADQATTLLTNSYNQSRDDLTPYRDAGQVGLSGLQNYNTQMGQINPNITVDYNQITSDPMYQFSLSQANELANRNLAAQGLTGSRYAVDSLGALGMQVAQSERDRVYQNQTDNYNRNLANLSAVNSNNLGMASLGQNAATQMASAGADYASATGDILTGVANAQAANILSQDALSAQLDSDNTAAWLGLAGAGLGALGSIFG